MTTVLLCHFDGSNGDTTSVDSSPAPHTLILVGNSLSTTQKKFGATSLINAAAQYVQIADSADWHFGSGQFTIEGWVYYTSAPGSNVWGFVTQFGGSTDLGFFFGNVSGNLAFYYSTSGTDNPNVGAAWTPALNTWYHIAVDRDASNVLRVYKDGAVHASATVSSTFYNSTRVLMIGNDGNTNRALIGHIDEVRITKGAAIYGGAFTPPSAPFNGATAAAPQFVMGTRPCSGERVPLAAGWAARAAGAFNRRPAALRPAHPRLPRELPGGPEFLCARDLVLGSEMLHLALGEAENGGGFGRGERGCHPAP